MIDAYYSCGSDSKELFAPDFEKHLNKYNVIHLGYLGYDGDMEEAYIPNYEVGLAYQAALSTGEWKEIAASISRCQELLNATIRGNADKVAELVELANRTYEIGMSV